MRQKIISRRAAVLKDEGRIPKIFTRAQIAPGEHGTCSLPPRGVLLIERFPSLGGNVRGLTRCLVFGENRPHFGVGRGVRNFQSIRSPCIPIGGDDRHASTAVPPELPGFERSPDHLDCRVILSSQAHLKCSLVRPVVRILNDNMECGVLPRRGHNQVCGNATAEA